MSITEMELQDNSQMLADSARVYMERGYGEAVRNASFAHPQGCAPQRWQEFAELGWLALPVPERDGGLGGSLAEICVVTQAMGQALVNEPYLACAVLGSTLLARVASEAVRRQWLPALADGSKRIAFAPWEAGLDMDFRRISTTARKDATGWYLQGEKYLVPGGNGADAWIVAARVSDGTELALFLLPANGHGIQATQQVLYDGQHCVHLRLEDAVAAEPLLQGPAAQILARLEQAMQVATVAHCAETVGAMQRAFEITLDYLKTRKQFGKAIASNQVVQHRLVDLHVEIAEARALTASTAAQLASLQLEGDSSAARRQVAATRACVVHTARHVWEESVQLHGAIGMTDEYHVGRYVKRLALACTLFGALEEQLEELAALALDRQ